MPLRPFIVLLALAAALSAQTKPAPKPQPSADDVEAQKAAAVWRDRAERLTSASQEDSWRIRPWDAVMKAHLAEAWWKIEPLRAHQWLAEADEEIKQARKNEPKDERAERLQTGAFVFEVMNRLDPRGADKLLSFLMEQSKDPNDRDSQRVSALVRMNLASATMDDDISAARIEQLGNAALQMHGNQQLQQIVDNLAYKDASAARSFYSTALNTAAQNNDFDMIFGLMQYPFPFYDSPIKASDDIKQQTLATVGQMLLRVPQSEAEASEFCGSTAPQIVQHLLPEFPPVQQGQIEARVRTCNTDSDPDSPRIDPDACKTADDCLKLAETATMPERSYEWKVTAMTRLSDDEQVRALDILDSATPEERKFWGNWTSDYESRTAAACRKLHDQNDSRGVQAVIDRTPEKLRAIVILDYVASLLYVPEKNRDVEYARLMLTHARRTLEQYGSDDPRAYLQLITFYVKLQPEEAPQAFGFIMTGLNQIEYLDPDKQDKGGAVVHYNRPGAFVRPIPVSSILLERDEPYTLAAIKNLDDPKGRIAFRLGLLKASLKRYEEALHKKTPPANPQPHVVTPTFHPGAPR